MNEDYAKQVREHPRLYWLISILYAMVLPIVTIIISFVDYNPLIGHYDYTIEKYMPLSLIISAVILYISYKYYRTIMGKKEDV